MPEARAARVCSCAPIGRNSAAPYVKGTEGKHLPIGTFTDVAAANRRDPGWAALPSASWNPAQNGRDDGSAKISIAQASSAADISVSAADTNLMLNCSHRHHHHHHQESQLVKRSMQSMQESAQRQHEHQTREAKRPNRRQDGSSSAGSDVDSDAAEQQAAAGTPAQQASGRREGGRKLTDNQKGSNRLAQRRFRDKQKVGLCLIGQRRCLGHLPPLCRPLRARRPPPCRRRGT